MDPTLPSGIFSQNQSMSPAPVPTPQQIQSAYAQANTNKGQGINPPQPIHAWTQGVQQIVQALAGKYGGNQADQLGQPCSCTVRRCRAFRRRHPETWFRR